MRKARRKIDNELYAQIKADPREPVLIARQLDLPLTRINSIKRKAKDEYSRTNPMG